MSDNISRPTQKQTLIDTVNELESIPGAIKQVYDILHNLESKEKIFPVSDASLYSELIARGFFEEVDDPEPFYKDWQLASLYEARGGKFPDSAVLPHQQRKWCMEHPHEVCDVLYPSAALWYEEDGTVKIIRTGSCGLKLTSRITYCRANLYMYLSCRMRDESAGYYDSTGIWDSANSAVIQLLSEHDPDLPLPSKRKLRIVRQGEVGGKKVYEEYDFDLGWVTDDGYENECRRLCADLDIPFESERTKVGNTQITYRIDPASYRPPYEMPHRITYYEEGPVSQSYSSPSRSVDSVFSPAIKKAIPHGDDKTITMIDYYAKSDKAEGCALIGMGILSGFLGIILMISSSFGVGIGLALLACGIILCVLPFIEKNTGKMTGRCPACDHEIIRRIRKDQKTLQCPYCQKRLTIKILHMQ